MRELLLSLDCSPTSSGAEFFLPFVDDSNALSTNNVSNNNASKPEWLVLVCSHMKRDKRCGVLGPMLVEQFHYELTKRGIRDKVAVYQVSHIGGMCLTFEGGS
jgi:hypothetical protein